MSLRLGVLAPALLALAACVTPVPPEPDAGVRCPVGQTRCGAGCVDTAVDTKHCGACGNVCAAGEVCGSGGCRSTCGAGKTNCGGGCVDTDLNAKHCGACGVVCPSNKACVGGNCQCPAGFSFCNGTCIDTRTDKTNCGGCGVTCPAKESCVASACTVTPPCAPQQLQCGDAGTCRDVLTDNNHCGGCGVSCGVDKVCVNGGCLCPQGTSSCGGACTNTQFDPRHCGSCGNSCNAGEQCIGGTCAVFCGTGLTACNGQCVDVKTNVQHCGACGNGCGPTQNCVAAPDGGASACQTCNSATTDCDGDGWTVAQGDCCDNLLGCGNPSQVNPGAVELLMNNTDDNCNGLTDAADTLDVDSCDVNLTSNSPTAMDYAKAMGLCRTTVETPATPQDRTWGVISAELMHANGSPLTTPDAKSIRPRFGRIPPQEGSAMVVMSSGKAADAQQTLPGPNMGPSSTPSEDMGSIVNILNCSQPDCISDWLMTPNPPLKLANELPVAPSCGTGSLSADEAQDSVMLKLRLRAPTNARSFSLNAFFFSSEYPEFVCTNFNDQVVVLVKTPGGSTSPSNPPDKNLLTYLNGNQSWPVGINLAGGTSLFRVCESKTANMTCWDTDVNLQSCGQGPSLLNGTGFEAPPFMGACTNGGGTDWLTTIGNVRPGEIVELRFVIWDVGDGILDSLVLFDNFKWDANPRTPGTSG